MSREEIEAGDLKAVAAALSLLAPSTGRLDRDRLMFLAGEAAAAALSNSAVSRSGLLHSAAPRLPACRWAWPAAFSTVSAVAATLLAMLLARPEPRVIERIVRVPTEPQVVVDTSAGTAVARADTRVEEGRRELPAHDRRAGDGDYLSLRDRVLTLGLDSWTSGRSTSGGKSGGAPHNHRELLESVLNSL